MPTTTPCWRHTHVWLASCPDCTHWHLRTQLALRDGRRATAAHAYPATTASPPLP
ncbi:hypothetical protein ACI789_16740 [Geodermatophilus sp. SYSU D00965]